MSSIKAPWILSKLIPGGSAPVTMVLEAQSLLSCQQAVNPAFLLRVAGVEGGQGLRKTPEALVSAHAVFHQETFQGLSATGGKQDHALVDAVEDGFSVAFDFR